MLALQAGSADAMAVLFDRYHRLVYSIAIKIVRDAGEAEDVVQNVFLDIFRSAGQFDATKGTCKVWVRQYAYHRAINRRQQLQLRNFYDAAELDIVDARVLANATALSASEWKQVVRQGMAVLTAVQRRVIEMACYEGLSLREVAERTGDSFSSVRHHYYRGIEKLREILEHEKKAKFTGGGHE